MPARPVAQLALPEFTTTARTHPPVESSAARPTSTGAATTRFFVNNAAAAEVQARLAPFEAHARRGACSQAREAVRPALGEIDFGAAAEPIRQNGLAVRIRQGPTALL